MSVHFVKKLDFMKEIAADVVSLRPAKKNDQIGYGPTTVIADGEGWFYKSKGLNTYSFWDKKMGDLSLAVLEQSIAETKETIEGYMESTPPSEFQM